MGYNGDPSKYNDYRNAILKNCDNMKGGKPASHLLTNPQSAAQIMAPIPEPHLEVGNAPAVIARNRDRMSEHRAILASKAEKVEGINELSQKCIWVLIGHLSISLATEFTSSHASGMISTAFARLQSLHTVIRGRFAPCRQSNVNDIKKSMNEIPGGSNYETIISQLNTYQDKLREIPMLNSETGQPIVININGQDTVINHAVTPPEMLNLIHTKLLPEGKAASHMSHPMYKFWDEINADVAKFTYETICTQVIKYISQNREHYDPATIPATSNTPIPAVTAFGVNAVRDNYMCPNCRAVGQHYPDKCPSTTCSQCGKKFSTPSDRLEHWRREHKPSSKSEFSGNTPRGRKFIDVESRPEYMRNEDPTWKKFQEFKAHRAGRQHKEPKLRDFSTPGVDTRTGDKKRKSRDHDPRPGNSKHPRDNDHHHKARLAVELNKMPISELKDYIHAREAAVRDEETLPSNEDTESSDGYES